jgi:hypothetical protein
MLFHGTIVPVEEATYYTTTYNSTGDRHQQREAGETRATKSNRKRGNKEQARQGERDDKK